MSTLISFVMAIASSTATLPTLHVEGMNLVDPKGKTVTLKGANLGNWLVTEFWMWGFPSMEGLPGDQFSLEALLTKRFGESEKDRLMETYRASWITERDFDILKSFGFNLVRLPMNYRLMEDDRKPFHLKANAWKWIDRAVDLSERHGLYILLDMHGAQGGQNQEDHSGHSGQNKLKDNLEDQRRLAWLWGEIAKRYKNRAAVVAYDPFNEPYGMPKAAQVSVFKQCYAAIRKNDPEKVIYAPGNYDDFDHYGDPKANGWHNVGFQMHYYPGMFGGGPPTVQTHVKHIDSMKELAKRVKALNVPFIVGEWNVVFDTAGGAEMMRRYFDLYNGFGWAATMWSYKVYGPEGGVQAETWGDVVNANPTKELDFSSASKEEIERYFRHFATDPLAINEKLRRALTDSNFKPGPLPPAPPKRLTAPHEELSGWTQTDVGTALEGGLRVVDGGFELFGGGADIWGASDQFRFLHRSVQDDFELTVTVQEVEGIDMYTKAGLMVRSSLDPGAPFVLISVFPDGQVQFASRVKEGAEVVGADMKQGSLPGLRLQLSRRGETITASFASGSGDWKVLGTASFALPQQVFVGAVALSHDASQLVKIGYRDLKVGGSTLKRGTIASSHSRAAGSVKNPIH